MQRCEPDPGTSSHQRGEWSESRVARELEAWFAQRAFDRWPTYRTFVRDGHKRLHAAVVRTGDAERWAADLGVPVRPRHRGAALSDDEVGDALRQLLRAHRPARFPTAACLKRHGPPGLAAAVRRTGGGAHWARVLNMPGPQPARWTDELIEAELRRVCADTAGWAGRRTTSVGRPARDRRIARDRAPRTRADGARVRRVIRAAVPTARAWPLRAVVSGHVAERRFSAVSALVVVVRMKTQRRTSELPGQRQAATASVITPPGRTGPTPRQPGHSVLRHP